MPSEPSPTGQPARGGFYDAPTIDWSLRTVGSHLHPGGEEATVLLAQRADSHGFPSGARVLDLGSGLGAPSRFLARRFAATVVGVDIERGSQLSARAGADTEGLGARCPLLLGVGEALPLAAGAFDAAWSQDALCHMHKQPSLVPGHRIFCCSTTIGQASMDAQLSR